MAKQLLSDDLWSVIAPLLPPERPKPKGGRPRLADRAALTGILFVLLSGIPWEMLPQEMGCGSGMTCWRRLREWQQAGVWEELHARLLDRLAEADQLDWSRVSVDSASVPAPLASRGKLETGKVETGKVEEEQAAGQQSAGQQSAGQQSAGQQSAGQQSAGQQSAGQQPGKKGRQQPGKKGRQQLKRSGRIQRIAANRARSAMLR